MTTLQQGVQSAGFRVSSQHWLWPWAARSSRDRWAGHLPHSSGKTIDWKVFSLCSAQLLLTGWNAAHTGFLSLRALSEFWPDDFYGQLSLLGENGSSNKNYRNLWVLAVVYFFFIECICKRLMFRGGWNTQESLKSFMVYWDREFSNVPRVSKFFEALLGPFLRRTLGPYKHVYYVSSIICNVSSNTTSGNGILGYRSNTEGPQWIWESSIQLNQVGS